MLSPIKSTSFNRGGEISRESQAERGSLLADLALFGFEHLVNEWCPPPELSPIKPGGGELLVVDFYRHFAK